MSSQSAGRRRSNMRQYSAEDQALNMISKEAESRLAAKRAARAEAREIRLKEIEKQQRESEAKQDRVYELTNEHNVAKNRQLVGSRSGSRRGSTESNESESKDVDLKAELRELEEKYKAAMMTSAQLDNEKQSLVYQVELLKDQLEEQDEGYTEVQRQYKDKCRDFDFQKRDLQSVQHELSILKQQLEIKDRLIEESGFVIVANDRGEPVLTKQSSGSSSNGPLPSGAVLVSQETKDFLEKSEGATLGIETSGILNNNLDVVDNKTTIESNKTFSDPLVSEEGCKIDSELDKYGVGVEDNVQLESTKANVDGLKEEKEVVVFSTDKSGSEMVHDYSTCCVPPTNVTVTNEHGVSVVPAIDGEGDFQPVTGIKRSRSFMNLSRGDSEEGDEFYDASDVTPSASDKTKSFQIGVESSNEFDECLQERCDGFENEAGELELEGVRDAETCTDNISILHMKGEQYIDTSKDIPKPEECSDVSDLLCYKPGQNVEPASKDGATEKQHEVSDIEKAGLFTEVNNDSVEATFSESKSDDMNEVASLSASNFTDSAEDAQADVQQPETSEGETRNLQPELITEMNRESVAESTAENEKKTELERELDEYNQTPDQVSKNDEEGLSSDQIFIEQIGKNMIDIVVGDNMASLDMKESLDVQEASRSEVTENVGSSECDAGMCLDIKEANQDNPTTNQGVDNSDTISVETMDELFEFHETDYDERTGKNKGETYSKDQKKEQDWEGKSMNREVTELKESEERSLSNEENVLVKTVDSSSVLSAPEVNDNQVKSSTATISESNVISQEISGIVVKKEEESFLAAAAKLHSALIGGKDSNKTLDTDVALGQSSCAEKSTEDMIKNDDEGVSDQEAANKSNYDFEDIEEGLDDEQGSESQVNPINNNSDPGATGESIQENSKETKEPLREKQSNSKKEEKPEKVDCKKAGDSSFSFFRGKQGSSADGKSKSQSKKIKSSKNEKKKNQEQDSTELVEPLEEKEESSKTEIGKAESQDSLEPKDLEGALDKEMSKSSKSPKKSKKKGFFKNVFK